MICLSCVVSLYLCATNVAEAELVLLFVLMLDGSFEA